MDNGEASGTKEDPTWKMPAGKKRKMEKKATDELRHSRRHIAVVNYREEDSLDFNEYCDDCKAMYKSECPTHGPLIHIPDTEVEKGVEERAMKTAPPQVEIGISKIPNANIGVWAKTLIRRRSFFGPYDGRMVDGTNLAKGIYAWEVGYIQHGKFHNFPVTPYEIAAVNNTNFEKCAKINVKKQGKVLRCVDSSDEKIGNWMRYVNCARHVSELNLTAFMRGEDVYYRALVDIPKGTELLVFYGSFYANKLGINVSGFNKPLECPLTNVIFKCRNCLKEFSSLIEQQSHHCVIRCFQQANYSELTKRLAITQRSENIMGHFTCLWCGAFFKPFTFFSHQNTCPYFQPFANDAWRKLHPLAYVSKLTKSNYVQ